MNYKVEQILNLQGIEPQKLYRAKCPLCGQKVLLLNPKSERGVCYRCGRSWSLDDLLTEAEEAVLDKRRAIEWQMKENQGVGY